ncbi:MAG: monovalent cation/H+ antiporter subunit A, partial [Betaproteobacteria bacterium]
MTLAIVILLPLLAGTTLALIAARHGRTAAAWAATGVTATGLALVLNKAPAVIAGHTLVESWQWLPQLGLNLSFRLDGLGLLFALLILGIGLLIILYARYYLSESDSAGKFYALLML